MTAALTMRPRTPAPADAAESRRLRVNRRMSGSLPDAALGVWGSASGCPLTRCSRTRDPPAECRKERASSARADVVYLGPGTGPVRQRLAAGVRLDVVLRGLVVFAGAAAPP